MTDEPKTTEPFAVDLRIAADPATAKAIATDPELAELARLEREAEELERRLKGNRAARDRIAYARTTGPLLRGAVKRVMTITGLSHQSIRRIREVQAGKTRDTPQDAEPGHGDIAA